MGFSREDDEKLRMFMEHTTSLVAIFDKNGVYEYVSPSHGRLLGYAPEGIVGTSGFDHLHPDDVQTMAGFLARGMSGEVDRIYGLEFRVLDKNRNVHYLKGNFDSIRDSRGNLKNIVFVGDDISNLRESKDALGKEKEKFRALMEGSPLGIFLLDGEGRITYVNSKFIEMFGYAPKDIATSKDWLTLAYPNKQYRRRVVETWKADLEKARKGSPPTRKYTVTCRDGAEKTMLAFPIVLEAGEQLVVCQDISRQEALEAQFMHAQKMESIGRLASGVAHDFNNLLTTILGNADFALMDIPREDPLYEVVGEIKEAADRATHLTRQLLTFSRRQGSHPEVLSLNRKIEDTEKMLKRLIGENIQLELRLDPAAAPVEMDPGQVEQVIMNLAVNARDAMPDGGRLTIETAGVDLDEDDPVSPVELAPGAYVLLSISDTGVGIPREILGQVFDPFFTTKEKGKGTGLGLSTVYGIVKQSKGNILIYSEPGKGTTVKMFIPAHDSRDASGVRNVEKRGAGPIYGTETILLTEDEARVRKTVAKMLVRHGYSVVEAGSGPEAGRLFEAHRQPIHLLLTDMVMPGMNGLDLIRSLRKARPDLKVLCMSGYTDSALFEEVREEGIAFIHKPFSPATLIGKIRELLDA